MPTPVTIHRFLDVARNAALGDEIDAIFFEASNTKSFESDAARTAFRERWLGRYLTSDPQFAYLALAPSTEVIGYLVGSVDDPETDERFRDLTKRFPAHLHVNLAPVFRGLGLGSRLIDAFVADLKQAGAAGVHVVTNATSANVRFYNRNGFFEAGRAGSNNELVVLGRRL
jgi:ribosomal protein S18 acetylase RimI-like enzyme